jgi:hypothetical protein
MFLDTDVDERISQWREFRNTINDCEDPFTRTLEFWNKAPRIDKYLNQYNSQEWPTPWEVLKQNRYCPVAIPLMIGWTLKLTTKFTKEPVLIKISIDHKTKRVYNLVNIKDKIIDWENNMVCISSKLPSSVVCQEVVELK